MRTTSSLEGFNSILNRTIANFYRFVERLRIHESRKADEMIDLVRDLSKKHLQPRHKKDQDLDQKIKHNTSLLCAKIISIVDFLNAMTSVDDCKYIPHKKMYYKKFLIIQLHTQYIIL